MTGFGEPGIVWSLRASLCVVSGSVSGALWPGRVWTALPCVYRAPSMVGRDRGSNPPAHLAPTHALSRFSSPPPASISRPGDESRPEECLAVARGS